MFRSTTHCCLLALSLLFTFAPVFAQIAPEKWQLEAQKLDDTYWAAFNRGDADGVNAFLADDVEFYHDRGGMLIGKAALAAVNDGMKTATQRIRREVLPGTVHIYPLRKGDEIYGAILNGEHRFYINAKGKPEKLAGGAIFSHLLLLKGKVWKIARIYSYEHLDAGAGKK